MSENGDVAHGIALGAFSFAIGLITICAFHSSWMTHHDDFRNSSFEGISIFYHSKLTLKPTSTRRAEQRSAFRR